MSKHPQTKNEIEGSVLSSKACNWRAGQPRFFQNVDTTCQQPLIFRRVFEPKYSSNRSVIFPKLQTRHAYFKSNIRSKTFEKFVNLYTLDEPSSKEVKTACDSDQRLFRRSRRGAVSKLKFKTNNKLISSQDSRFTMPAKQLEDALLRHNPGQELIYSLYCKIPRPGVVHLSDRSIRILLKLLFSSKDLNEVAMLRYLTILDDMIAAEKPLLRSEWTSAMVLTGRCVRRISAAEVESVLYLWRKMEHEANVEPSEATFNVLFDVAAKAGKFALAEVLHKEMKNRNLRLNRQSYTGYMLYQGLRGDGEGVKMAYEELVKAGEIVDTVVLNCVITSLLAVGEISAAELVFERMKALHFSRPDARLPPKQWQHAKDLCSLLNAMAGKCRDDASARQRAQSVVPVAPNSHTFSILVRYHAYESGNLDRMTELIGEMFQFSLFIDRTIFFLLFKGFQIHGGLRYSAWTKVRLEGLWTSYKETLTLDPDELAVERFFAITVLLAFKKCIGDNRMREVWDELYEFWKPEQEDVDVVVDRLGL